VESGEHVVVHVPYRESLSNSSVRLLEDGPETIVWQLSSLITVNGEAQAVRVFWPDGNTHSRVSMRPKPYGALARSSGLRVRRPADDCSLG
jgi:hypothetical protein